MRSMRRVKIALRMVGAVAALNLLMVGASGCGTTTIIHQTVIVGTTPSANSAVKTPTAISSEANTSPPPGIWCPVKQGQMPLVSACEIYPSEPQLYNPPQGETVLAGAQVGPQIGSGASNTVTERMKSPWAADVNCGTNDDTNNGEVRIFMVAHTASGDYYSWGNESCGPPAAPSYGNEFFRKATVSVTLSIQPLTNNLAYWQAELIQL